MPALFSVFRKFCIWGDEMWQHPGAFMLSAYLQASAHFIYHSLDLYSSVCHFYNHRSQYRRRNWMIPQAVLFFGVSGSVSVGDKVQRSGPNQSSSKNPPVWHKMENPPFWWPVLGLEPRWWASGGQASLCGINTEPTPFGLASCRDRHRGQLQCAPGGGQRGGPPCASSRLHRLVLKGVNNH